MVLAYLFVTLSLVYGGAVYIAVAHSAREAGGTIRIFDTTLFTVTTVDEVQLGVIILCALSASAAFLIVLSLAYLRGRYLRRRSDTYYSEDTQRAAGDAALELLLENRVNELEMSIDRLTVQRDSLVTEVRTAEARSSRRGKNGRVVIVPESTERLAVVDPDPAPAKAVDEPA